MLSATGLEESLWSLLCRTWDVLVALADTDGGANGARGRLPALDASSRLSCDGAVFSRVEDCAETAAPAREVKDLFLRPDGNH